MLFSLLLMQIYEASTSRRDGSRKRFHVEVTEDGRGSLSQEKCSADKHPRKELQAKREVRWVVYSVRARW